MISMNEPENTISSQFILEVKKIVHNAQNKAVRAVNIQRVVMYWEIGQKIVIEEQNGADRAKYGMFLISKLSKELTSNFGSGYSQRQLETCRQFYKVFPIAHTLRAQLNWTQ